MKFKKHEKKIERGPKENSQIYKFLKNSDLTIYDKNRLLLMLRN